MTKGKRKVVTEVYFMEKIEAYNVAIESLLVHESASDNGDPKLAKKLRERLAARLRREINEWAQRFRLQGGGT